MLNVEVVNFSWCKWTTGWTT